MDQFANVVLAKNAADGIAHAGLELLLVSKGIVSDPFAKKTIIDETVCCPFARITPCTNLLKARAVEDRNASAKPFPVHQRVVKALSDDAAAVTATFGCRSLELNAKGNVLASPWGRITWDSDGVDSEALAGWVQPCDFAMDLEVRLKTRQDLFRQAAVWKVWHVR